MSNKKNDEFKKRDWHPAFIAYTEFIVSHPNYAGLTFERTADGQLKWVVAGKSEAGKLRKKWWDDQCNKRRIPLVAGCYAKAALEVHPTKVHICQICGKELNIRYVYPGKRVLKRIEEYFGLSFEPFSLTIFEILERVLPERESIEKLKSVFSISAVVEITELNAAEYIRINFTETKKRGYLSPGVMSNSPDRYDGFHSDGACCRHKSDKGRHLPKSYCRVLNDERIIRPQ